MKKITLLFIILVFLVSCTTVDNVEPEVEESIEEIIEEVEDLETKEESLDSPPSVKVEPKNYLLKGEFEDRMHRTEGTAYIIEDQGIKLLKIDKDFRTENTENLKVLLTKRGRVFIPEEIYRHGYKNLGELKYLKGEQYYEVPEDYEDYLSVAIHSFSTNEISGNARLFP